MSIKNLIDGGHAVTVGGVEHGAYRTRAVALRIAIAAALNAWHADPEDFSDNAPMFFATHRIVPAEATTAQLEDWLDDYQEDGIVPAVLVGSVR